MPNPLEERIDNARLKPEHVVLLQEHFLTGTGKPVGLRRCEVDRIATAKPEVLDALKAALRSGIMNEVALAKIHACTNGHRFLALRRDQASEKRACAYYELSAFWARLIHGYKR